MMVFRSDGVMEWQLGPPAVVIGAHEPVTEGTSNGVRYRAVSRFGHIVVPRDWREHAALVAAGATPFGEPGQPC